MGADYSTCLDLKRRKMKKTTFLILLLCIGTTIALTIFFLPRLFIKSSILEESVSPDGRYIAHIVMRNGGATTLESYQLYITPALHKTMEDKYLVLDTYNRFHVQWNSTTTIQVDIILNDFKSDIFYLVEITDGIVITYTYNTKG